MPLRFKLLLILLIASVFPIAGFRFVRQMEATLRQGQEQSLIASAQAIANALLVMDPRLSAGGADRLYAREINFSLSIDGYGDDWRDLKELERQFKSGDGQFSARVSLARNSPWLYLLMDVSDASPVPPEAANESLAGADRIAIALPNHRLDIACERQGAAQMSGVAKALRAGLAACERRPNGYLIEARLPLSWVQDRLGIAALDMPVRGADFPRTQVGTFKNARLELLPVQGTGMQLAELVQLLPEGTRARVIGPELHVLTQAGSLRAATEDAPGIRRWLRASIYRSLLAPPLENADAYGAGLLKLNTRETKAAVLGNVASGWRSAGTQQSVILTAAVPLGEAGRYGAVALERMSDTLLIWTNRGLGGLLLGGLATVIIASGVLFGYTGYLSLRIRGLRISTEAALSPEGRIRAHFPRSNTKDDIGELSRAFARLLEQVGQYNDYLRTLASKLSHELATPLAMVKGSLDNLESLNIPEQARTYSERARHGVERLGHILRAMSEASRIERAIDQAESESFDLRAFVMSATSAYQDLPHRTQALTSDVPKQPVLIEGAPELLHQALDKLIDNAISFAPAKGWIRIELKADPVPRLRVLNSGPPLPEKMQDQLFQSMVSMRDRSEPTPHLGLGLFIVRLVAELHGGQATAENLAAGEGVCFELKLPGIKTVGSKPEPAVTKLAPSK